MRTSANEPAFPYSTSNESRRGAINYNHIVYVDAGRRYLEVDLEDVRRDPLDFVRAFGRGVRMSFESPTSGQGGLADNLAELAHADRFYDAMIGWQPRQYSYEEANERRRRGQPPDPMHVSWSAVLVYGLALATLPAVVWHARRRIAYDTDKAWTLGAASATIWLSFIANNAFDLGENARFRFETDPLAWVLAAVAVTAIARMAWRAHRTSTDKRRLRSTVGVNMWPRRMPICALGFGAACASGRPEPLRRARAVVRGHTVAT